VGDIKVRQLVENECQQPSGYNLLAKKTAVSRERDGGAFRKTPPQRFVSRP